MKNPLAALKAPLQSLKLSLNLGPTLARLKPSWPRWPGRRVKAEAVDVPPPGTGPADRADSAENSKSDARAAARDKLAPVGIRRNGPGRRATDLAPRRGDAELER
ncbi:MAG: hypothetical protein AB9M60_05945, partial [Leptothrix sp. (in: b-proteobacteria)]